MAEQLYSSTVMGLLGPGHHSLPFPASKATERVKGVKEKSEIPAESLYPPNSELTMRLYCSDLSKTKVTGMDSAGLGMGSIVYTLCHCQVMENSFDNLSRLKLSKTFWSSNGP